jgi:CheY-like chemotaxis protein
VPDVIFLDLMLPDADGYDICRFLKSSGDTRGVPVIIVTARITIENRMESFRAGADDFIPKPYMPDQIFEALVHAHECQEQVASSLIEGEAVLDARDEGQTLRSLARLRNALATRSGLERETIEELTRAIKVIWSSAIEWGNRRKLERVASIRYSLSDLRLCLTINDEVGWLEAGRSGLDAKLPGGLVSGAFFDQVVDDPGSRSVKLVKRIRPD